jgi:DNA (cytosine-5)-methyltransferase 1
VTYLKRIGPGQNWRSLPPDLQRQALGRAYFSSGGRTGFLRRLAWDEPSPTLLTSPIMPATLLAHPEEDRPLSVEEYARIQTFPDEWTFAGTTTQKYRQIGNAVPVLLGRAIGVQVKTYLQNQTTG